MAFMHAGFHGNGETCHLMRKKMCLLKSTDHVSPHIVHIDGTPTTSVGILM